MNQRLYQESVSYTDLIHDVKNGFIQIPNFHRGFLWGIDKTAELFDSILKGYPIGVFILWQTDEQMGHIKKIGNLELPDNPDKQFVKYVLDGQQRITSLYAAHCSAVNWNESEKKKTDYKEIYIDLTKDIEDEYDQIVSTEKSNCQCISLNDLLNIESRFSNLQKIFSPNDIRKIFNFYVSIKTYNFSTIILKNNDINSAIQVFTRINMAGRTLTLTEIVSAKTYDESKNFHLSRKLNDYIESLVDVKFNGISSSVILNLISLLILNDCKRSAVLSLDKVDVIGVWEKAVSAINQSIEYFRNNLWIPVSQLLPYDAILVPFAYFFCKCDNIDRNQKRYLEEFFWCISLSYRYSGSIETRLTEDINLRIVDIINGNRPTYNGIKIHVNEPKDLVNKQFYTRDSFCKAILCLFAQQEPRNFNDNSRIILDNSSLLYSNGSNYHRFFPKMFLKNKNYRQENSLMNITLVSAHMNNSDLKSRTPSEYIFDFANKNTNIENSLRSHFISLEGFGIESNDYYLFLERRSKYIYQEIINKLPSHVIGINK